MAEETKNGKGAQGASQSDLERLANIILAKQGYANQGGTPHVPLSAEELAKLTPMTMDEKAAEYYAGQNLNDFPWPGIHVTSDLHIFFGNVQGENARDNYVRENKGMTYQSYPKPAKELTETVAQTA